MQHETVAVTAIMVVETGWCWVPGMVIGICAYVKFIEEHESK